jgi:RNA polymerase sigma-70 factor, ECF subfamily
LKELDWSQDQANLRLASSGDPQAVALIVAQLYRPAFVLAYQMLLSREDAEDCVQESFYRLWRAKDQFQANSSLKTYFSKMVIHGCYALLKDRRRWSEDGEAWPDEEADREIHHEAAVGSETPLLEGYRDWSLEEVRQALLALPAKQRMALVLWAYHDLSSTQIAEQWEMNKNAIDQLIFRAKKQLRKLLEKDSNGTH